MQKQVPHKTRLKLYASSRTEECLAALKHKYMRSVEAWQKLKSEGVCDRVCQQFTGISRATYYRYRHALKGMSKGLFPPSKCRKNLNTRHWGEAEKQLVLEVRRKNPTYGKEKISIILARDRGRKISISTVGRILKFLFEKGTIRKSLSAPHSKKKRNFRKKHAIAWTYKDYDKMKIGERVQIDHMTVTKNGRTYKHFQAWDRRSKFIHAQVYPFANAISARRFLLEFIEKSPFEIRSIQVDGGSGFMADFEEACREAGLPLIVLPPKRPTCNGGVERGNRIFKEEFYYRSDLLAKTMPKMREELTKALARYNSYRPHKNLDGLTPMGYLENMISGVERLSQNR